VDIKIDNIKTGNYLIADSFPFFAYCELFFHLKVRLYQLVFLKFMGLEAYRIKLKIDHSYSGKWALDINKFRIM